MNIRQSLYFYGLLAYLAILPMAGTVALRSLLVIFLLGILLCTLVFKTWRSALAWPVLLSPVFVPLLLWVIYLCAFPLWAEQPATAWENLRGQWGMSIAAWIIGAGGVLLLGRQGPSLWQLGLASAMLVMLHLLMTLLAWSGLLGANMPSTMPLAHMLTAVQDVITGSGVAPWSWQPFPWGFRGFDTMHGNLGYTANQAIILFMCYLVFATQKRRLAAAGLASLGVVLCFMSVVIAHSRGAVLYGLLMALLAGLVFYLRCHQPMTSLALETQQARNLPRKQLIMMQALLGTLMLAVLFSFKNDERWHQMLERVQVAFVISDPVGFLCNGQSEETLTEIREHLVSKDPVQVASSLEGLKGDGGRILLMRAGVVLLQDVPLGLDGSRFSYRKLMNVRCGHPPVEEFSHAHQGWLDTAFALGWLGAGLLLTTLMCLAGTGWRYMRDPLTAPWALALFLLAAFWILRGFADSVYREHFLQMQAVLLAYVCARVMLENKSRKVAMGETAVGKQGVHARVR
jgi:hypothetical protein